jgi:hypothetical protein
MTTAIWNQFVRARQAEASRSVKRVERVKRRMSEDAKTTETTKTAQVDALLHSGKFLTDSTAIESDNRSRFGEASAAPSTGQLEA